MGLFNKHQRREARQNAVDYLYISSPVFEGQGIFKVNSVQGKLVDTSSGKKAARAIVDMTCIEHDNSTAVGKRCNALYDPTNDYHIASMFRFAAALDGVRPEEVEEDRLDELFDIGDDGSPIVVEINQNVGVKVTPNEGKNGKLYHNEDYLPLVDGAPTPFTLL